MCSIDFDCLIAKTDKIGLTENFKGDENKFLIQYQTNVKVYVLQASPDDNVIWVYEIKKVLFQQFHAVKGQI